MQRKLSLCTIALLAIVVFGLSIFIPGSWAQARSAILVDTPTPTPNANTILNQANAVATQSANTSTRADRTSAEAQNTLNVVNFIITFFSLIVGVIGLLAGALATYAFNTIRKYRKQLDDDRLEVAKKKSDIDHTLEALVYLGLGDRLFNQDKKQEAIEIYRKVGSLLPEDAQINNTLGRIYSEAGYYEDAINSFKRVLTAEPDSAEAHYELGLAYRRHGDAQIGPDMETARNDDYSQAITYLSRAIELRPNYEDALAGLGAVYRRMGDKERDLQQDAKAREYYERARKYYEQAHMADPLSSYALGNVASLSWYLDGQDAASSYFVLAEAAAKVRIKNAGRSAGVYWDYYDLALAQLVIGEVNKNEAFKDKAKRTYETAIRLTPGTVQFDSVLNNLYLLQKAQERIDRLDLVIKMLEAAKSG